MLSRQKQKLLILQKILLTETDEDHKLSCTDIIRKLSAYDIKVERKTVYDDISTLVESGMDIACERTGHANFYYVASRLFQDEELCVLADAAASSKFLTKKKSNELIKKLQCLTSKYKAMKLKRSIYVGSRVKTYNESIYYSINSIHEAIYSDRRITFKYIEYDINKNKRYRHHGEIYEVSPYTLVWENDCYYLICFCQKHDGLCRYRVDRMADVSLSDEHRRVLSMDENELAKELTETYSMYGGTKELVTLEMSHGLINVVIDRFGDSVHIRQSSLDKFRFNAEIQISPTFWGWLFQFGSDAQIISPEWVRNQALIELDSIRKLYSNNTQS